MTGSFTISRCLWDDAAFQDEPFSEREAWVWMIAEARWKPQEKRVGSAVVALERGQLAHSTRFLSEAWKWSHAKVRRFLERLENRHMIRRETGTGVSVITICKYNEYQLSPDHTGTATAQQPAQRRHSSGTNLNKGNKVNNTEAKASDGQAVGLPLPDDQFADEIWNRGVAFLERKGVHGKGARSFIGKLRKDHSDAEIFAAFSECSKAGAVDPIPWITRRLTPEPTFRASDIQIDLTQLNPDGSLKK
jgi:hypothetical protein